MPADLRGAAVRLLVPGEVPPAPDVAVSGLLHLGGNPRGAGADPGVDARELPADDPRSQAHLRSRRRGRDQRLDFFRHPRRPARDHAGPGHREFAPRDGDRARGLRRAGGGSLARKKSVSGRGRGAARAASPDQPAPEPVGRLLLAVPRLDCVADHARFARDVLRRLAVQGDRQGRLYRQERPDRFFRPVQLLGGPRLPGAPAHPDLAFPAPLRPRARVAGRAARGFRQRARRLRRRHAGRGDPAQGRRLGRALFARQVFGGASVPAHSSRAQAAGQVDHRHRHLAAGRRPGRLRACDLHGSAPLVGAQGVARQPGLRRRLDRGGDLRATALCRHPPAEHPAAAPRRRATARSGARPLHRRHPGDPARLRRPEAGPLRPRPSGRRARYDAPRLARPPRTTRCPPCASARSGCSTPPGTCGSCRVSRRCFGIRMPASARRLSCFSRTTPRSIRCAGSRSSTAFRTSR